MTIARLSKVTVMGQLSQKEAMLSQLQELGCMHLIPLSSEASSQSAHGAEDAEQANQALRFLQETGYQRRQTTRQDDFEVLSFVGKVLDVKYALRLAQDKRDFLKQRIKLFEPWGNFTFPPHMGLKGYQLWFYVVPHNKLKALESVDMPWQIVSKDNRFAYVVLLSKQEPDHSIMPVERSHLGSEPLSELKLLLEDVEIEIESLTSERQALTSYIHLLSLNLNQAQDLLALSEAHHYTLDNCKTAVIQGWVEVEQLDALESQLSELGCAFVYETPHRDETPPTLIEQPEPLKASEDLATFYQVPDYRSFDPGKILFLSFSVFFSMILADAGYGVVLLLGLLAGRKKLLKKEKGKGYFNLGLSLCVFTLVYGVIVGSYFGVSPGDGTLLANLQLLDLQDFDSMMTLSILIGVFHIGLANVLLLLSSSSVTFRISRLGWLLLILSGAGWWLFMDVPAVAQSAQIGGGFAILLIFLFSSEQQGSSAKDWLLRAKDGLLSIANIMTAFGDILSYMRLFALGLASASLAITFNQLAVDAYHSMPGVGLLAAVLIVLVGHILNLLLSLISGVVHGLRLNYIEFYKWGLPAEGKAFKRFAKKEINHE